MALNIPSPICIPLANPSHCAAIAFPLSRCIDEVLLPTAYELCQCALSTPSLVPWWWVYSSSPDAARLNPASCPAICPNPPIAGLHRLPFAVSVCIMPCAACPLNVALAAFLCIMAFAAPRGVPNCNPIKLLMSVWFAPRCSTHPLPLAFAPSSRHAVVKVPIRFVRRELVVEVPDGSNGGATQVIDATRCRTVYGAFTVSCRNLNTGSFAISFRSCDNDCGKLKFEDCATKSSALLMRPLVSSICASCAVWYGARADCSLSNAVNFLRHRQLLLAVKLHLLPHARPSLTRLRLSGWAWSSNLWLGRDLSMSACRRRVDWLQAIGVRCY